MLEKIHGFMNSTAGLILGLVIMLIPLLLKNGLGIKHSDKAGWTCCIIGLIIILYCIVNRLK